MIDGPRIHPAGGPAKKLVVFLHGYGADGNDLIDIGRLWAPLMPDTAFVSPPAPDPCAEAPVGRQWFPLAGVDPAKHRGGVTGGAPALDAFLDAELASHRLFDDRLALVGFSQGAMMALHVAPRRARALAGVVGYSGLLPATEYLGAEVKHRPPVLLVHGDQDAIIPPLALFAAERLRRRRLRGRGAHAPGACPRHRPARPRSRRRLPQARLRLTKENGPPLLQRRTVGGLKRFD